MTTLCLLSLGCNRPEPNPELKDPIYGDLKKRWEDEAKAAEEQTKKVEELEKQIEKLEPHTVELKTARRDLVKAQDLKRIHAQNQKFYEIRMQQRLHQDHMTYRKAFEKGELWPDPKEYQAFQVNQRLREAPLNWELRVPRMTERYLDPRKLASTKKEKPKEGGESKEH